MNKSAIVALEFSTLKFVKARLMYLDGYLTSWGRIRGVLGNADGTSGGDLSGD